MLGRAKRVSIDKDNTTIVDGAGKKRTSRPASLRSRCRSRTTSDYDREKLQERLAKLAGGVAVIKVWRRHRGRGEGAQGPRRRRAQRHRAAVEAGVVRAVVSRCSGPPMPSPSRATTTIRMPASRSSGGLCRLRSARSRTTRVSRARSWSARCRVEVVQFRLRCAERRVRRSHREGHHRPGQGCDHGPSGCRPIAGLLITTEAGVAEAPKKKEAAPLLPAWAAWT